MGTRCWCRLVLGWGGGAEVNSGRHPGAGVPISGAGTSLGGEKKGPRPPALTSSSLLFSVELLKVFATPLLLRVWTANWRVGEGSAFSYRSDRELYLADGLSVLAGGSTDVMTGFQTIAKGLSLSQ